MLTTKVKLDGNKTKFIDFQLTPSASTIKYHIKGGVLTSPSARNLGVTFDNKMLLGSHVQALCKSADYQLFHISWIQKYLTPEATATLIHSLIMSRLDYYKSILYKHPKTQLYKLQLSINSTACLATLNLKKLHWLATVYRINFKILCITYKALHGLAPNYITHLIKQYYPAKNLRSVNQQLLCIPKMNLKTYGEILHLRFPYSI